MIIKLCSDVIKLTCEKSVFDSAGLVSTNARTKCVIQVTGGDGGATGSWGPFGFDGKRPRRPRKLSVRTTEQVLSDCAKRGLYLTFFNHSHGQTLLITTVLASITTSFVNWTILVRQTNVFCIFLHSTLIKSYNKSSQTLTDSP